ncbi:MAG: penicillin-binding protein activator [Rhodothalassiaceae bacterium]
MIGMYRLPLLLLALFLFGCAATDTPGRPKSVAPDRRSGPMDLAPGSSDSGLPMPPGAQQIRIAVLLPLSGPAAEIGHDLLDAATIALFDARDPRLSLLPFDTGGSAEGARRSAEAAVAAGASVAIGPLFSENVQAAAPVLSAAGIPLLGLSNDAGAAGPGVYLMGFMPDQEVTHIISHAIATGHRRIAALLPLSPYGERVMEGLGATVLAMGGEIVSLMRFEPDPDRLAAPIRQLAQYDRRHSAWQAEIAALEALGDDLSREILKRLETEETIGDPGFDAVLIAAGDPLLRSIAPLLPYYEIDPAKIRFLGTGLWDDPLLAREPPLRGGRFPAPDPKLPQAFLDRFESLIGHRPARIVTLAYDAMSLVALLAREPVSEERFSAVHLEDPAGFSGLDGPFRFRSDGIAERLLAILEIGADGMHVVVPAAAGFAVPGPFAVHGLRQEARLSGR